MAADDLIVINFPFGTRKVFASQLNITNWPPPEELTVDGMTFTRRRHSKLTDEQLEKCPNVCRGAEYDVKAANDG